MPAPVISGIMGDHYFSANPSTPEQLRRIAVTLADRDVEVTTAGGVFSPDHVDTGTRVLLANAPEPPAGGDFLDLGAGWGPISLSLAMLSPRARIWAVDVNERALDLVRRNADDLGLDNVNAVRPEDVPADVSFRTIWSNPPIRVGKAVLHELMETWLPRLAERSDAYLVVQRNLGSDSLHRWLEATLEDDFSVHRHATSKGFRVLRVRHQGPGAAQA
ncbi:methyltransferase [Microbacterium oryzae]